MWKIAYNIALCIVLPFFLIFSLTKKKIRQNLIERLFPRVEHSVIRDALWIHAASIGEAAIAEAFVWYVRNHSNFHNFVLTTNTYYTRDLLRRNLGSAAKVFSLPLDLAYSIRRFLDGSTFKALIIVETELWPNLVWLVKGRKVPVIIINGRISDATLKRYGQFSFFLRHVLSEIDLVLAQSGEHARRFVSIGMDPARVITTGNLKYYREISCEGNHADKDRTITFGSIKEKELGALLPAIINLKNSFPDFMIFIAPRDLFLVDVLESALSTSLKTVRYSIFKTARTENIDLVIVDTVGDLLDIYKKSKVAFVGGSLEPYGGQNILEPLFFGTPVLFGPHMENFKDIAGTVIEEGAGMVVNDGDALYQKIKLILENEALRAEMAANGRKVIARQKEVMEKTTGIIADMIGKKDGTW